MDHTIPSLRGYPLWIITCALVAVGKDERIGRCYTDPVTGDQRVAPGVAELSLAGLVGAAAKPRALQRYTLTTEGLTFLRANGAEAEASGFLLQGIPETTTEEWNRKYPRTA